MKKMIMVMAMTLVMAIGMPVMAAEVSDYDRVRDGLGMEIIALKYEEDDDIEVTSVDIEENAAEQVATYVINYTEEDTEYKVWIYLNGKTDEMIAIAYNVTEDEIEKHEFSTLTEAAELYK